MAGNPYLDAFDQFAAMQPPDPNTFLKLIWPHLDQNTRALIETLLRPPSAQPAKAQPAASPNPGLQFMGTSADGRYHVFTKPPIEGGQYVGMDASGNARLWKDPAGATYTEDLKTGGLLDPTGKAIATAAPGGGNVSLDTKTGTVTAPDGGTFGGPQVTGAKTADLKTAPEGSKGTTIAPGQKRKASVSFEEMGPDGQKTTRFMDIF